jgi:hypothetical protein
MPRAAARFRKYAILTHRWMGIAFCALFAMWFASGMVLMYWDYPGVAPADRLARAAPLHAAQIRFSPEEAFAALGPSEPPDEVRIATLAGRPIYRFRWGQDQSVVYADTGELQPEFSPALALATAAAWAGQPAAAARFEGILTEPDQWTVSGEFRALRPLFKYSWPDGVEVYVSRPTGEVVQATTRGARVGAWFGAIPHWLYFTPLRRHGELWSRVVIWASGIGTAMSLFGLLVGVLMFSPAKRYHFPEGSSRIPYAGQKRWHTMLGLIFGLVTCSWIFSGMLSMDPFGWESSGQAFRLNRALRGGALRPEAFAAKHPSQVLEQVKDLQVKELVLTTFGGVPAYLAAETPRRSRIVPLTGSPAQEFNPDQAIQLLADAVQPYGLAEVRVVREYESYYLDRHQERPLPVLFVRLRDPDNSMYYVDLKTARIVAGYVTQSRWNRWLYHGLHSMDLPWLYRHRPAWDIIVLALMLGGTALSVTALVIGWRRLRRKLRMRTARARLNQSRRALKV